MMKTRFLTSLGLLLLLLAACAPAEVPAEPAVGQPAVPAAVEPSPTAFQPSDSVPAPATEVLIAPTEALAPVPAATSRGDDLHASTFREFNRASGGLQFVEFFRFT